MINQLLLAQVLAEGSENIVTVSNFLPVLSGVLTLIGTLFVAWWNGRKADRQMDFSKRSKPPELARYKELLEISKAYKELVNFENVDALNRRCFLNATMSMPKKDYWISLSHTLLENGWEI